MTLDSDKLKNIVKAALSARSVEIGCDACLVLIDEYAEQILAEKEIPEAMKLTAEHLELCGGCREEFEALLSAIRSLDKN